jgi:hypothetical protein
MATKKMGAGGPDSAGADSVAMAAEIQLTLAKAQLAMAEALLALASGRVPGAGVGAAIGDVPTVFEHAGTLELQDGALLLKDVAKNEAWSFSEVPDGKLFQLEFTTRSEDLVATAEDPNPQAKLDALVDSLADFMKARSSATILGRASCGGGHVVGAPRPPRPPLNRLS